MPSSTCKKRKNDQFRKGSIVLIEKQGGAACPVELCARLIKEAGLTKGDHLLANLVKTTGAWKTKKGHLQYSRALELFKQAVKAAGLDPGKYGLHSLRAGGMTAAAAEKVPERLLKRHSGWRSEAIHNYVEESLEHLLQPSRAASWAWGRRTTMLCVLCSLPGRSVVWCVALRLRAGEWRQYRREGRQRNDTSLRLTIRISELAEK